MDTVPTKYVSLLSILVSIIILVWYGVVFFHNNDDVEVSDILVYVLSWWQLSIVSSALLFCIHVYNTVREMKDNIKNIETTIAKNMSTEFAKSSEQMEKGLSLIHI